MGNATPHRATALWWATYIAADGYLNACNTVDRIYPRPNAYQAMARRCATNPLTSAVTWANFGRWEKATLLALRSNHFDSGMVKS